MPRQTGSRFNTGTSSDQAAKTALSRRVVETLPLNIQRKRIMPSTSHGGADAPGSDGAPIDRGLVSTARRITITSDERWHQRRFNLRSISGTVITRRLLTQAWCLSLGVNEKNGRRHGSQRSARAAESARAAIYRDIVRQGLQPSTALASILGRQSTYS